MITRVGSQNQYDRMQLNIGITQNRAAMLQTQISSRKKATDYAGLGDAGLDLAALQATRSRLDNFKSNATAASLKMTKTESVLNSIKEAVGNFRANLVTATSNTNFNQYAIQNEARQVLTEIVGYLNTKDENGQYLFSGSKTNTAAVAIATPAQLTDPDVALSNTNTPYVPYYQGDTINSSTVRADDNVVLDYSVRADASAFEQIIRGLQAVITPAVMSTPITTASTLTAIPLDSTVLNKVLDLMQNALDGTPANFPTPASPGVIDIIANIGVVGKQLDGIQEKNLDMSDLLDSSISAITDTDLVTAMSELSNVTTAIQASYYLVSQLKNNSLVRYLN